MRLLSGIRLRPPIRARARRPDSEAVDRCRRFGDGEGVDRLAVDDLSELLV